MPNVRMPDGAVVSFPDDMPQAKIQSLISSKYNVGGQKKPEQWNDALSGAAMTSAGYLGGFGDEIYGALAALGAKGVGEVAGAAGLANRYDNMSIGDIYRQERDASRASLKSIEKEDPGIAMGGQITGAVLNPVKMSGGMIARGAKDAAMFALGNSEADLTKGEFADAAKDTAVGGSIGALTGGLVKGGSKILKPAANKAVSATRKAGVEAMKRIGIDDLTPGQMTGNRALNVIESAMDDMVPTASAARAKQEGQLRKFTKAALSKAGIEADELTPAVRQKAEKQFSDLYEGIFAGERVGLDDAFKKTLRNFQMTEASKVSQNMKEAVKSYISDLRRAKVMTGRDYQAMRSRMTKQANSLSATDPFAADAVRSLRNILDSAASRSIPQEKFQLLQEVNNRYGNYKTLTKAISTTTDDALEGLLSPKRLLQAVETNNKTKSQAGYGDLYDLARSGSNILRNRVASSGTSERQLAQRMLTGGASVGAGAGAYAVTGDPATAALAAGGLLVAPKVAQKAINSKAAQKYFSEGIPLLNRLPDGVGNIVNRGVASQVGGSVSGAAQTSRDYDKRLLNDAVVEPVNLTREEPQANAWTYFDKLAQVESSGNPNAKAKTSSASGLYQFTDSTWASMVNKYGKEHGITMKDKLNPAAQRVMVEKLTAENERILLQKTGQEPNEAQLYAAHFMGPNAAARLIKEQGTRKKAALLFPKAAKANKSIFYQDGKPRTVEDVMQILTNKMEG